MSQGGLQLDPLVTSHAFKLEALRSEQIRIMGLLVVLGAILLFIGGRTLLVSGPGDWSSFVLSAILLSAMAAYEGTLLWAVRRGIQRGRVLPAWSGTLTVVVETLLPTCALLIATESQLWGPYRALVSPVVLTYFFFITLSTLRLSPSLAWVTGLTSAIGYASVATYTLMRYPVPPEGSVPVGRGLYVTYAVFLLIGGWIAGEVARQIRRHVNAAQDEALKSERVLRDLEVARSIQQGLLPESTPQIPGFDIAGWNQPADQTGGDFYHWESLSDGRIALVIADVTGHGIGSALIAMASRAYGRACVAANADSGVVMTHLDDLLSEDLPQGKLVNYISVVLDSEHASLDLLSAGQAPLLIYRAVSDTVDSFKAHGVPLGVGLGLTYGPAQHVQLAPGDILVLVTDGFFEWGNPDGEQFGLERLDRTIQRVQDRSATDIISALYSDVIEFANGTVQEDDLTAIIVKREAG